MKQHFTFPSADRETKIHAILWTDETKQPRAVVQLIHGMVEYIDRYDDFAKYLASQGFAVVGHDHLGHGQSVTSEEKLGYIAPRRPANVLLQDIHRLRVCMETKFQGLPYFMLGHSMGSYLLRRYLSSQGDGLAGAIIMGTGQEPDAATTAGLVLVRSLAKSHGWDYRSVKVLNLTYNSNYKKYDLTGEDISNSWLTKDEEIVKKYYSDPLCTFLFTLNAFEALFSTVLFTNQKKNIMAIPDTLPLLLVSGAEDPVGALGKGVKKVYDKYVKSGIKDVTCKLFDGDRHEILNETDRADVYAYIQEWLETHLTEEA